MTKIRVEQMRSGSAANGYVITANGSGVAEWKPAASGSGGSGSQVVPIDHPPVENFYLTGYNATSGSFASGSVIGGSSVGGSQVVPLTHEAVSNFYLTGYDAISGSFTSGSVASSGSGGVTDHTELTSIGTTTHEDIDTALTRLLYTSGSNTGDQIVAGDHAPVEDFYLTGYDSASGSFSSGSVAPSSGSGSGDVIGPATNTADHVPQWDGANSKTLKDGMIVVSGSYLPTLYNTTNVAASTAVPVNYIRIGNVVVVSGMVYIDVTSTSGTALGMSLPIASTFSAFTDIGGNAGSNVESRPVRISADTTNHRARFVYTAAQTANAVFGFTFSYRVQ